MTTQTISVPVIGDTLDEPDETYTVDLKNPTNAKVSGGGFGLILDDDVAPGISVDDFVVTEGDVGVKTAAVTVKLSAASGQNITVGFATLDNTASAGSDYAAASGSLTFNPGEVTKTVNITINGDTAAEPDETFFVDLTSPTNGTVARARGTVTILTDDVPILLTEEGSERAIAFESMTMTRAPFSTEIQHLTVTDKRTRIMLFARNVELQPGESFNVVEAKAEDSLGRIYPLTVEFVGKVPGFNWLTQINVRLADELIGGGDVRIYISLRGAISNKVIVSLKTTP